MVSQLDVGGVLSCGGTCGFSSEKLRQNSGNREEDVKIKACRRKSEEE